MAGYTRNDTAGNIADGNIISAAPLDGEFDAIEGAFNASTGHTHDGTAANGGRVTKLGPSGELTQAGSTLTVTTDVEVSTDKHIQFRDSGIRVKSGADGQLDIDADGEVEIVSPTVDIDASTAVTIDTATLTITGAANVTGDLDVDNINIDGNTIISTDTDGNIALTPNGTGEVDISKVDIDSGAIDGVTLGTNSAVTEAQIDNININGNAITSTDTDGNIALTPNGTGEVDISKVDIAAGEIDGVTIGTNSAVTDLRVDNIKVDGNTVSSTDTNGDLNLSPNGTGTVVINTDLDVDNINIDGNAITSTNTNGDVVIAPNGTGALSVYSDKLGVGFVSGSDAEITTNGAGDLTLSTNSGTNSGTIKIEDGANQDIVITPNGSGSVQIDDTDAGSSAGPLLKLFRNSSSPADDDELGQIQFIGKDSGGGTNTYATITGEINDASAGTENGLLKFDVEGITTDYGHGIYESLAVRAGSAGFPIVYFGHGETQLQWFKWGGSSSNGSLILKPAAPAVNNDRTIELPDQSGILGYVALSTTTVTTAVADITFDNLSTTFDAYAFHINLHPASDGVSLRVQFLDSAGSAITSSAYFYGFYGLSGLVDDNSNSNIRIGDVVGNDSHEGIQAEMTLLNRNYADTSPTDDKPPVIIGQYDGAYNATNSGGTFNGGLKPANEEDIRGIKFFFSAGNIDEGSISVYGIQKKA